MIPGVGGEGFGFKWYTWLFLKLGKSGDDNALASGGNCVESDADLAIGGRKIGDARLGLGGLIKFNPKFDCAAGVVGVEAGGVDGTKIDVGVTVKLDNRIDKLFGRGNGETNRGGGVTGFGSVSNLVVGGDDCDGDADN